MKNAWDSVLDNQKKVMDFWGNMAQQMTPNTKKAEAPADMFTQWMEQQKSVWEQWMKGMKPEDAMTAMPEQLRQWAEMQQKF
ncbi:MAG TPA: hypothetical protein PK198_14465, partial [Saprospiraceae bacterium]|nr:hypothetical protein [Saprospiraceae bacterium]